MNKLSSPSPVYTDDMGSFEQERAALLWFEDNLPSNPKKLVKLAKRIYASQPDFIQLGFLNTLLRAADPIEYVIRCANQIREHEAIIASFVDQGSHGMIIDGVNIHGIEVKAPANWLKVNDKWSEEQEFEIQETALVDWLNSINRTHFNGKVVLFTQFGFSGIPRWLRIEPHIELVRRTEGNHGIGCSTS